MITSFTSSCPICALRIASRITVAPRVVAGVFAKQPLKVPIIKKRLFCVEKTTVNCFYLSPIAVLTPDKMNTLCSLFFSAIFLVNDTLLYYANEVQ